MRSYDETVLSRPPLRLSVAGSLDDEAVCHMASDRQLFKETGSCQLENRMRRCVSLDRLVSKGAFPARSSLSSSRLGSAAGLDGSMKSFGLRGTRQHSQSMYLDLVQHKGTIPKPGFKGRSTSMHSLNRDFASDTLPDPPAKQKLREAKVRHGATNDPGGQIQARALLRRSSSQPSVVSDLIQLLRFMCKQHVSAPAGSRIPVLKRLSASHLNPCHKRKPRTVEWKSLYDLSEEFDDEYTPVRVKVVHPFSNPSSANHLNWQWCAVVDNSFVAKNNCWYKSNLSFLFFVCSLDLPRRRVRWVAWNLSTSHWQRSSHRQKAPMRTWQKHWKKHRINQRYTERIFQPIEYISLWLRGCIKWIISVNRPCLGSWRRERMNSTLRRKTL